MTETVRNDWPRSPWRVAMWGAAVTVMLLPWLAMELTAEVAWGLGDFIVFTAIVLCACGVMELGARMNDHLAYRAGIAVAAATGFMVIWVNLAVGIIGSEHNPANWMFDGVLLVPVLGALAARFRPRGMAWALAATAAAQAATAGIAVALGYGYEALLTGVFIALWTGSALLFRWAARSQR
ncbi:hypothetical protein LVB77_14440 [Lysobacter sp. 5GHs7-4]|uniref:hypothetical protein n=1 Tax=Lysobacter sp. 5GHs7-4 TaxID=2904253 RepID=UPI001E2EE1EB|nr:hypothetical protein [Lysobacter sp. 5GHs7-4]UHQ21864.1 hypothetical protein LVB77_14440 [Lysobacter sp. 5GHs7-4]